MSYLYQECNIKKKLGVTELVSELKRLKTTLILKKQKQKQKKPRGL